MQYTMRLINNQFDLIKNGVKTIELRLNDEKRRSFKVGDTIIFTNIENNTKLLVEVISIEIYNDFEELFKHYSKESLGYKSTDNPDPKDMLVYYTNDEIVKYGVLAIEISLKSKSANEYLSYDDFLNLLHTKIENMNGDYIDLISGNIHRELGGYPGKNHRMPPCCKAMRNLMSDQDKVINEPKKGNGATLTIRYYKNRFKEEYKK